MIKNRKKPEISQNPILGVKVPRFGKFLRSRDKNPKISKTKIISPEKSPIPGKSFPYPGGTITDPQDMALFN